MLGTVVLHPSIRKHVLKVGRLWKWGKWLVERLFETRRPRVTATGSNRPTVEMRSLVSEIETLVTGGNGIETVLIYGGSARLKLQFQRSTYHCAEACQC